MRIDFNPSHIALSAVLILSAFLVIALDNQNTSAQPVGQFAEKFTSDSTSSTEGVQLGQSLKALEARRLPALTTAQ